MPIRVLIADDHAIVRTGLRALLNGEKGMDLVGEATGGEEALRLALALIPDIVVMDLSMPDLDGIEVTRRIKAVLPQIKVLILTVHEDEAFLREAIHAGASGYIIKHAAESELISAIHTVQLGDIYVHPKMITALFKESAVPPLKTISPVEVLTPRENDVLRLIVQGYTNRQIGQELNISFRTVEGHRSNISDKLGLHSRVELVRYARQHGLIE